ncbi:hypothetical protein ABBQ32_001606 [Trebouxia sp. C0010 RCD-2024]
MAHLFDPDVDDREGLRPRLRSRGKTDNFSPSSNISSLDDHEFRTTPRKKKAGRPIAYKGDPDSKALTDSERRKIKRRIANRESARRVRAKRAGTLEELQIEMDHLTERNSSLLRRVAEAEGANAAVKGQIQEFYQKLRMVQVDNSFLQQQTAVCQKQQKVRNFRMIISVVPPSDCLRRLISAIQPSY